VVIEVGPFCLKSTEDPRPFCDGQIGILLPPTTAVYFPVHASSHIMIMSLVKHVKQGMSVLDIGTGTGILAVVAEKLGASKVCATEIHPDALEYAEKLFALNNCTKVQLIRGSFVDEHFDVIACNVDGPKWVAENIGKMRGTKIICVDDKSKKAIVEIDNVLSDEFYELDHFKRVDIESETITNLLRG
jgi:protein-L-isoaspartate O-methyltransferase